MSFRRSELAHLLTVDPTAVRTLFQVPAVVWQTPSASGEAHWERTSAHVTTAAPHVSEPVIFRLAKVPEKKNPFPMGVTAGRVETNDIVLDHTSVSRFHAWLQLDDKQGGWALYDADSKNGSHLNDLRLTPRERTPLKSGDLIRLGEVRLRFLSPDAFLEWLDAGGD